MRYDCVFFFFFKQKTAYEIGTGDWSSDVCSSDLILERDVCIIVASVSCIYGIGSVETYTSMTKKLEEIGRASCRERV